MYKIHAILIELGTWLHLGVKPIFVYSLLCWFPEDSTIITTIYVQEMSYGRTVKSTQKVHNVAH